MMMIHSASSRLFGCIIASLVLSALSPLSAQAAGLNRRGEDGAATLLQQAYAALQGPLKIGAPMGGIQTLPARSLLALQFFHSRYTDAYVSIEVSEPAFVWVCVPNVSLRDPSVIDHAISEAIKPDADKEKKGKNRPAPPPSTPLNYYWYEYELLPDGTFVPVKQPLMAFSPYPTADGSIDVLRKPDDWAGPYHNSYDTETVIVQNLFQWRDGPPHWSPVLLAGLTPSGPDLHDAMQDLHAGDRAKAVNWLNTVARPQNQPGCTGTHFKVDVDYVIGSSTVYQQDFPRGYTERAMKQWEPVTLRGVILLAHYPDPPGDFVLDHTDGYSDGHRAPHRTLSDVLSDSIFSITNFHLPGESDFAWSDPAWPRLDWDMHVLADPDVNYLTSEVRRDVGVEIEHFALESDAGDRQRFFPQSYEWLQATGRWAVDCGHEKYTEIHPAEMLVSSAPAAEGGVRAKVLATGAWIGEPLSFVVYPPPRGSVADSMDFSVEDKTEVGCHLEVTPWPKVAPNHLVCTITSTNSDSPLIYYTGMVGMTPQRRLQAVVKCAWRRPMANVHGTVTAGPANQPARGAAVYYRSAMNGPESYGIGWSSVPTRDDGSFSLTVPAGSYWIRPAGPGYDFSGVPASALFSASAATPLVYRGAYERYSSGPSGPSTTPSPGIPAGRPRIGGVAAPSKPGRPGMPTVRADVQSQFGNRADTRLQEIADAVQVQEGLAREAVNVADATYGLKGVNRNGFGMTDSGDVVVHVSGLDGDDGKPLLDPAKVKIVVRRAVIRDPSGRVLSVFDARSFAGAHVSHAVANARIHARLLVGGDVMGYHPIDETYALTDGDGDAHLHFTAGTHTERVRLQIQVTYNPYNPWFTPTVPKDLGLYQPALAGDDLVPQVPYRFAIPIGTAWKQRWEEFGEEIDRASGVAATIVRAHKSGEPRLKTLSEPPPSISVFPTGIPIQRPRAGGPAPRLLR